MTGDGSLPHRDQAGRGSPAKESAPDRHRPMKKPSQDPFRVLIYELPRRDLPGLQFTEGDSCDPLKSLSSVNKMRPSKGGLQYFIIGYACQSFRHISDIVTISPEVGDDARIAAFIGKKFHFFTIYPKAICSSAR
jgi:hypothetical protein